MARHRGRAWWAAAWAVAWVGAQPAGQQPAAEKPAPGAPAAAPDSGGEVPLENGIPRDRARLGEGEDAGAIDVTPDGAMALIRIPDPDPRFFDDTRRVIFVNGMGNDPVEHQASALALSRLEQCPVVGIFNATAGTTRDLRQCIADAWQFSRPAPGEPAPAFEAMCRELAARGDTRSRGEIMRSVLARNPAAGSLYDALNDPALANATVYAHSQGNLIATNVLQGMAIALGPESIAGRRVHSFGSPCRVWPRGILRSENSFAFDPVTWMGRSKKMRVARVVVPTDVPWYWPFAHSLGTYLEHDAEFVVNRRRLGGVNVSVAMDEKGLARDLFEMGRNMPRIDAVLRYVEREHRGNTDDVVRAYVDLLRAEPAPEGVLAALRAQEGLVPWLIEALERGYTSGREDEALAFLRGLPESP